MTELFANISEEARDAASTAFDISLMLKTPAEAAEFLHNFTEYYVLTHFEPEIQEFLQFYFNMRLEALQNDNPSIVG